MVDVKPKSFMRISIPRFLTIQRWVSTLFLASLVAMLFIDRMPKVVAGLVIGGFIVTMSLTALFSLGFFFKSLDLICPLCQARGTVQPGEGFVCPECGPLKCGGIFAIRCERRTKT
jgi:hypothetical protein